VLPLRGSVRGSGIGKGTRSHTERVQSGGGVIEKANKTEAVQLNPTANLADSFNRGLKVNRDEVDCAESTLAAPVKAKCKVTEPPPKVTDTLAKVEEPWEPLWMRQMRENGTNLNLTGTFYPRRSVEEPVGRPIWSPPKGGRGRGESLVPLRWRPSGDSLLSDF